MEVYHHLNAGNITKPHAIQQLTAEVTAMRPAVVVITESWMTPNHRDELFNIPGYTMFRRDRNQTVNGKRREGGNLLIYAMDQLKASIFIPEGACDNTMELIWITFQNADRKCFIGGIYHPPKPIYQDKCMLQHLGSNLEYTFKEFPMALVTITGDFNQLPDNEIQNFGIPPEEIIAWIGYTHRNQLTIGWSF